MQYLKRKALTKKFDTASSYPLIIVYTPKGFGKRTFISKYLMDYSKKNVWFHLAVDADEEWQWNAFQNKLMAALQIKEQVTHFAIPENKEEFMSMFSFYSQYTQEDIYIVIDGVTGTYPKLQRVIDFFSSADTYCFHIILISDLLHNKFLERYYEHVKLFKTDDFRLTYHDVIEACAKEGMDLSNDKVDAILSYSDGWIAAIELILLKIKKEYMLSKTSDINALINNVFYQPLSEEVKKDFMYLGILDEFTLEQMYALCESPESIKEILQMENNQLFIHGTPTVGYTISGLLRDFLKIQLYQSTLDIHAIYQRLAQWFSKNNEPIKAITLYLKYNDFEGIVQILSLQYERSYIESAPSLMIDVFNRMPMKYKYAYPYVYLSHILDTMTDVDTQRGLKLLDAFKEDVKQGKYAADPQQLLGEYYFIHAFSHYNNATLMMDDFDRAGEAFNGAKSMFSYPFMIASFGSYHILYLYHREVGELASLVKDVEERNHTLVYFSNGVCGGGEYQVKAEYAFETGDYEQVLSLSNQAFLETQRYQQVSIGICTLFLRARYAILMNDNMLYQEMITQLENVYQSCNTPVLRSEIECAQAYLHLLEGNPREVADWVKNEQVLYPKLLHEAGMISFIILCFYQVCTKHYDKIAYYCTILENMYQEQMHIFGELYAKIFRCIALYHLDNKKESHEYFHAACALAQGDHLVTIFKELGSHLKVLVDEVEVLTPFEEEVVGFLQEQSVVTQELSIFYLLTRKEKEIMMKYANGMTTKQISGELTLSINTVQTHLKSIYSKLKINSKIQLVQLVQEEHAV